MLPWLQALFQNGSGSGQSKPGQCAAAAAISAYSQLKTLKVQTNMKNVIQIYQSLVNKKSHIFVILLLSVRNTSL